MKIGVCTISGRPAPVEDVLQGIATTVASGVEIWGREHIEPGTPERCEEIRQLAEELQLDIPVYGSYVRPGTAQCRDIGEREIRIARDLNASMIRVWAGEQEHQDVTEAHWNAVVEDLEWLAERATDAGIEITVERHAGTVTNTMEGARELMTETPACVGLNYQPSFDDDVDTVARDIETLAPLANNVHIQAKAATDASSRCPLAFAYFDVADLLSTLAHAGFDGYVEVEFVTDRCPYRAAVATDVAFLEVLLEEIASEHQ